MQPRPSAFVASQVTLVALARVGQAGGARPRTASSRRTFLRSDTSSISPPTPPGQVVHILALDTARFPGSLALLTGGTCHHQQSLPSEGQTAQTLFVTIARQLDSLGWKPADIGLVAVTAGPGSFTGLRIGVTLAKTWAYARRCHVLGLNTLDVLAAQCHIEAARLEVVMNAERRQLFVGRFVPSAAPSPSPWQQTGDITIQDRATWIQSLAPGTAVSGDGLIHVAEQLPDRVIVAERDTWSARAATLGQLAWQRFQQGQRHDLWQLAPHYYRPSAAEERK